MPAIASSPIPSVGEALREFLASKGTTQVKAAQTMGISRGHLNEIIGGEEDLSADIMLKLHHHFGVAPGYWTTIRQQHEQYLASPEGKAFVRKRTDNKVVEALELSITRLLADHQIEYAVRENYLNIEPFQPAQLTCTSYILTLGEVGLVTMPNEQSGDRVPVALKPSYDLPAGAFVTISCREHLRIPGRLRGMLVSPDDRFVGPRLVLHMKRIVSPGHTGPITVTIENRSSRPVPLRLGESVAHIEFEFLSSDPVRLVEDV